MSREQGRVVVFLRKAAARRRQLKSTRADSAFLIADRSASALIARADSCRDAKQYRQAADLYEEALNLQPSNAPIHVQCGHMLKELGKLSQASRHYQEASRLMPEDADLALQLGHFHKVSGHLDDAEAAYTRAQVLRPGWSEPDVELARLRSPASLPNVIDEKAMTPTNLESTASETSRTAIHEQVATALIARADAAKDDKRYWHAAVLYEEALRIQPDNVAIQIMCGHMFKDSGDLESAELHYSEADRVKPNDADITMQFGHLFKMAGRLREAKAAYEKVAVLRPDWWEPTAELAHLRKIGWVGDTTQAATTYAEELGALALARTVPRFDDDASALRISADFDQLVGEIRPRQPHELWQEREEGIHIRKLGRRDRTGWGMKQVLGGVEALRGFLLSKSPILELQILLNGQIIHRGSVRGGYTLHFEKNAELRKYVFNVWLDFSPYARGQHEIELRFIKLNHETRSHHEHVVVISPIAEADYPDSTAVISLAQDDARSIEEQVNTRRSMIVSAKRELFPPIRNVLILRTDQLGDMVTSIPAMRRLRELLPDAHFVGLLTSGNADFAATLGLFDEIIVIDFPDDRMERRRIMPLNEQETLRRRLEPYRFDIALDLAEASTSRPLLLLSGAKFLYGFHDNEWPWLTAGFEGNSRDPKNEREILPQSSRVLGFVERLGAMLKSRAEVIRRSDLAPEQIKKFGLSMNDCYVVMHTGARIEAARWPHFIELSKLVLAGTTLKVVLMADDATVRRALPLEISNSDRFLLLDRRLEFDDFDALISYCASFVGNDSGPKHLASLRGVPVISLQSARVNWKEWGQEMVGSIITRKVPCAGCQLVYDNEECGRNYVCLDKISPEEVLAEMMSYL